MSNPQAVLAEFYAACARSADVKKMMLGREVEGIEACVRKIVLAAQQDAVHIFQAADDALAELRR